MNIEDLELSQIRTAVWAICGDCISDEDENFLLSLNKEELIYEIKNRGWSIDNILYCIIK